MSDNEASPAIQDDQNQEYSTLAEVFLQRSDTYAFLARLYREEVDQELLDGMHDSLYPADSESRKINEGYFDIATYLSNLWDGSLEELKIDYAKCFLGHGVDGYSAAYPFESVYTSPKRLLMDNARSDVLKTYKSFGILKSKDWKEGEDHISLELSFEQILSERTHDALLEHDEKLVKKLIKAQLDFLDNHLLNWVPLFTHDMKNFAKTKLYKGVAELTNGFLEEDKSFLNDVQEALD
ncbi:MAG: molecular chaperone TorD family protein [Eggerthellaceae bacterium]|nr:molecular chaperone TorD family protein [Eggerthellaceae bacterium]